MRVWLLSVSFGLILSQASLAVIKPVFEGGSEKAEAILSQRLTRNILGIQKLGATKGKLNRGTHAKGICMDGKFEVVDVRKSNPEASPEILDVLSTGLFKKTGTYSARVRFANGRSVIGKDADPDVRALSFSADLKEGKFQDFSMNNVAIFPIDSLTSFNLLLEETLKPVEAAQKAAAAEPDVTKKAAAAQAASKLALEEFLASLSPEQKDALDRTKALGKEVVSTGSPSYRAEVYWSGTAFKLGENDAVKYIAEPCKLEPVELVAKDAGADYLQKEISAYVTTSDDEVCFTFSVQLLDAGKMELDGKKYTAEEWVENPTLDWDAAGVVSYPVGKLTVNKGSIYSEEECNDAMNAIDVTANSLEEHAPLGRINRGRGPAEKASREARAAKPAAKK